MENTSTPINHIMDTAFWVATYRAEETLRPNALFKDPLAARLTGELGKKITAKMVGSKYVRWTVVTRTIVIDRMIEELVSQGVDTVLNLGAGLDTRPYRMKLPQSLKWIEVDYENTIQFKQNTLKNEKPVCELERVSLDLSKRDERLQLFSQVSSQSKKVLVITEGVIPYLSEDNVAELADDLRSNSNFQFWITEYMSPSLYRHLKNKQRMEQMRNAPFQFFPKDWYGLFDQHGWKHVYTRNLIEESNKVGRSFPMPFWSHPIRFLINHTIKPVMKKSSGYILLTQK